jgi:hypothetical protein
MYTNTTWLLTPPLREPGAVRFSQFGLTLLISSWALLALELAISVLVIRSGELCAGVVPLEAQPEKPTTAPKAITDRKLLRTEISPVAAEVLFLVAPL